MMTPLNNEALLPYLQTRETAIKSRSIRSEDIIMIRGEGTYSWLFLRTGKQLFTSRTIKYWIHHFKTDGLIKVHRSYVIHRDQIEKVELKTMNIQMCGGHRVSIARSKKKMVKLLLFSHVERSANTEY